MKPTYDDLVGRIELLEKLVIELQKENQELKRRLAFFENAHTPPSRNFRKKPPAEPSGKLGAKEGHPKWEREQLKPTKTIVDKQDACPHCKHKLGKPIKTDRRLINKTAKPRPAKVIEYLLNHYKCKHCGRHIKPKMKLPRGSFGYELQTEIALLNVDARLPLRKIRSILQRNYKLSITDAHIYKMLRAMGNKLSPEYNALVDELCKSPFVHVDETEIKINGKTYWLWVFTNTQTTVFTITKSRSQKTIKEILREKYAGIIICDGWSAYPQYTDKLQRCWAHILREAKHLTEETPLFKIFYENLCNMFNKIKQLIKATLSDKKRQIEHDALFHELTDWLDCMESHSEFKKFATKMRNGGKYWFTCILHPFIQPTNNAAEQALREPIVRRKIFGCLRNEKGAQTFSTLTSIITTHKQQGHNLTQAIVQSLKNS